MWRLRVGDLTLNGVDVGFDMPIGGEDVEVAIEIKIEEEACEGKRQ